MARAFTGDYEVGDFQAWEPPVPGRGTQDARFLSGRGGMARILTCSGRKMSTAVTSQAWTARYPLNETVGTTATDTIGAKNGTYLGDFVLNQTGIVAETGAKSALFNFTFQTGMVNLGSNGFVFGSQAWGIFAIVKPSALGASHRGIVGGPTGALALSIFSADFSLGVVGGGSITSPWGSAIFSLNSWNYIGVGYDGVGTLHFFLGYQGAPGAGDPKYVYRTTAWPAGVAKATVASNQIGRRDTSGYFSGNMQEVLFR